MKLLHENRCRQCKKLFCCVNCRLSHEHKKHLQRELKCSLCCSKKLQLTGDESHEFICHLIFNHLPLLCRLCGQSFKSSEDLALLQKCGWWGTENSERILEVLGKTFLPPTPFTKIKASLNSCNNNETVSDTKNSSDFVTFNSPPVLTRNTSTPMNVGFNGPKSKFELKSLNALSFLLKTPRNISLSSEDRGSWPTIDNCEIRKCNSDSQYSSEFYSQSKSSSQINSLPQKSTNSSNNTTDYYSCDQLDSNSRRRSGLASRLKDISGLEIRNKKDIKESTKRVRFSDQFEQLSEMAENDEFFEAYDSLSEISQKFQENEKESELSQNGIEETSDVSVNKENQLNVEKENKVCLKEKKFSLDKINILSENNNNNNILEVNKTKDLPNPIKSDYSNPAPSNDTVTIQKSGSSRVLMMVLVENTSRFSPSKLAPLIDSGLRKLEQTAASLGSVGSPLTAPSSQMQQNITQESGTRSRSVTSVNSYVSVTSTECYSAQSGSHWSSNDSEKSTTSGNAESSKTGGIFSVVARVVRSALRKLPGSSLLKEDLGKSIMNETCPSVIASTSVLPKSSSNSQSIIASTLNQLPSKRPRDAISPPAASKSTFQNEESSPIAKRPRGWYKIRAREPIARMRKIQITSPKGISSETQRFQQGSLSVGKQNTILPLPARAHQFTQTE